MSNVIKKRLINVLIIVLAIVILIPLSVVFHELGHYIVGNLIYGYNGSISINLLNLSGFYVSDIRLDWFGNLMGGLFSAIILIIPLVLFKNVMIKIISGMLVSYELVCGISEAFFNQWYVSYNFVVYASGIAGLIVLSVLVYLNYKNYYSLYDEIARNLKHEIL